MLRIRFGLVFALAFAASLAVAKPISEAEKVDVIDAIGRKLDRKAYAFGVDFSTWPDLVENHRDAIDAAKDDAAFEKALASALDEFDISHLSVFRPDAAKLNRSGRRTGIGISLHPVENGKLITYVMQNSPASRCGLRKGDLLVSVDGIPLDNIEQLAGELGQRRTLSWIREDRTLSCTVEYSTFPSAEKSSMTWLREDVAVIKIQSFQYRFYQAAKINHFFRQARHAKAIIIDLRNNRGGLAFYSRHLASKIAPSKTTFSRVAKRQTSKGKTPDIDSLATASRPQHPLPFSKPYNGQVIVLVDSLSASAADIFPAFVQDNRRGIVVGEKTAGALQLARTFQLPHGFRLYLPIAEILTPKGKRLEGIGLIPDIELELEEIIDDSLVFELCLQKIDQS